jgi:hypothetical protein
MADTEAESVEAQAPQNGRALPVQIDVDPQDAMPPHSPRETSMLTAMTGKGFQELVGDGADDGDRERVMVWFTLRRLGYQPSWEDAADVLINYTMPDPQNRDGFGSSPPSVTGGT